MAEDLLTLDLSRVYLEIDETVQQLAWQASRGLSTPASCWRAYLNQLCLNTVSPWLEAESSLGRALSVPKPSLLPTLWEFVTGSAVVLGPWRFILLPTESIDLETLSVPQEWVDIPGWAGDYYLTVQANLDEGWLQVANFTTHRQLKEKGTYDWRDRTYRLDATVAIDDLNVLWVSQDLYPEEAKRMAVADLPALSKDQADSLIQRLGMANANSLPRLAIPFEPWAALLTHGGWRRQLAEHRWGRPERPSVIDWLTTSIDHLSQQIGWQTVSYTAATSSRGSDIAPVQTALTRPISIANQAYQLEISPQGGQVWRFALRSAVPGGLVPADLTLRLLTEDRHSFEGNEVTAYEPVESIFIDVELAPGEGIVWETQPIDNQYDPEILRF